MTDDPRDRGRPRTPAIGIPLSGEPAKALEAIGRAARDTQQTMSTTLDRVGALDAKLGGRIDQLDSKVDDLAIASARVEGKVDVLTDELRVSRIERSEIRVSTVQAAIEIEKTGEIAKVNEAVALRADRRQAALRVLQYIVGPVLAAAITYLLTRC